MNIQEIMNEARKTAKEKGFAIRDWSDIPQALCLIHSEISEALEEYRDEGSPLKDIFYMHDDEIIPYSKVTVEHKPVGLTVELADALIRICHLAEDLGLDLEEAIKVKMAYNKTRPHKHGKVC